jgi:hypothetical protein
MSNLDIARALKDKTYFNSLTDADKAKVRASSSAGDATLKDSELDTVSGGLGGGEELMATTTTTAGTCSCSSTTTPPGDIAPIEIGPGANAEGSCSCSC